MEGVYDISLCVDGNCVLVMNQFLSEIMNRFEVDRDVGFENPFAFV